METYTHSGIRGVATTVKAWAKSTRKILANEVHTRALCNYQSGWSKTTLNWTRHIKENSLLGDNEIAAAIQEQGIREIPPWFMDKMHIRALLPAPPRVLLENLVTLSNTSRTQPPPGKPEVVEALHKFKRTVEAPRRHSLRVRGFVAKCFRKFRGKGVTRRSHWSVANTASGDYSRQEGGKTQEVIDRVLHEFMQRPLSCLVPDEPPENLVDITGTLALRKCDWDPGLPIGNLMFPELVSRAENRPDARLGHIGLLWAISYLRREETCDISFPGEISSSGLFPESVTPQADLHYAELRTRVEALVEEGWKVRVITITSMAATVIGHVARHILDPILWSDRLLSIGLKDKVKLWSLLRHIRNPPEWADSVDLTTATDVPPDEIIRDVLHGVLDGIQHPLDGFLRFACDLASSKRRFHVTPIKGAESLPAITDHRRGIMMGEPLSGIFLNGMSFAVRCMFMCLKNQFPELQSRGHMTNDDIDEFISQHTELQSVIDSLQPIDHVLSTQSGDDVVVFDNVGNSNVLRLCYRIFEMEPSESTWFSSNRYALFTEEVALNTGTGWKFVDAPKPRIFATSGGDPDTDPILGKINLLSSYLRYIVEERGVEDHVYRRSLDLADLMCRRDGRLMTAIKRGDLPVGLPQLFGGISHPVGLQPGYLRTLKPEYIRILNGYRALDPLELCELNFQPDELRGVPEDLIRMYVKGFIDHVKNDLADQVTSRQDILMGLPENTRANYHVHQEAARRQLKSVPSALSEINRKIMFLLSLEGKVEVNRVSPIKKLRWTSSRLSQDFLEASSDPHGLPDNLVDFMKEIAAKTGDVFIPRVLLDDYLNLLDLPVMSVTFV